MTKITYNMMQNSNHSTPIQSPSPSIDAETSSADPLSPHHINNFQPSTNNAIVEGQPCSDPNEALELLNMELGRLRDSKPGCALFRAYAAQPMLFDDGFKRGFLHAENYVVKAAADRMISYWEARADLFGNDRMLLPMDKSGALKEEDNVALERGVVQILPQRDTDGHALVFYDPSRHDPKLGYSNESMLRVVWYLMHVAMSDPLTKENGFVLLVYPKQCTPEQIDRDLIAKGLTIVGSIMPLPWKGFHICHPCSSYNKYFPLVKMLSPTRIKDNIAVHFGTDEHVLQCMASYALPPERLPTEVGGTAQFDFSQWVVERKQAEGARALRISTPRPGSTGTESVDEVMLDMPSPLGIARARAAAATDRPKSASSRSSTASPRSNTASPAAPSPPAGAPEADATKSSTAKTRRPGRKGDARMHRAVTLKMASNDKSLVEALQEGGFNFDGLNEKGKPHHEVFDQDGVSLMQRKNQLLRRIRVEKKKKKEEAEAKGED